MTFLALRWFYNWRCDGDDFLWWAWWPSESDLKTRGNEIAVIGPYTCPHISHSCFSRINIQEYMRRERGDSEGRRVSWIVGWQASTYIQSQLIWAQLTSLKVAAFGHQLLCAFLSPRRRAWHGAAGGGKPWAQKLCKHLNQPEPKSPAVQPRPDWQSPTKT